MNSIISSDLVPKFYHSAKIYVFDIFLHASFEISHIFLNDIERKIISGFQKPYVSDWGPKIPSILCHLFDLC